MQPKIIIKSLVFAFLFLSCQDNVLYKSPVFLPHCVGGVAKGWLPDSLCADPTRFLSADTFRVRDSMTFAGIVVNAGTAAKTYQWDLGDGRIVEGAVARTIYSQGGIYHPIFRVGDSVGGYLLDSVYVVVKTPPDSVVLLYPPPKSVDIDPKKLLLKWQGFDRDTFGGPLRYTVIVKRAGGMIDTVIHKATITQFDLSGVIRPGETVSWKAIAHDGFGDSITCAYASFTALIAPYLTALGRLTVNGASWPCVDSLLAVKIDTVPYSIDSLRIEVAAQDSQARLSSGSDTSLTLLSVNRALQVGENAIPITVIAYENVASRTYILHVRRIANNDATLRDLAFSVGNLMTPFKPQKDTIRDTVPNINNSITITARAADSLALVSAIGATPSSSFALTFAAPLKVGPNSIKLTVVAADSVTKKDYVLSIFRRYNSNVALCSLTVLAGTVAQKLGTGNDTLRDTVAWAITSLTIAAKACDPQAQVRIGTGSSLGTASQQIDLNIGINIISIRIIAADSITTRDYVLSVVRLASSNATLSFLSVSSGTLTPSFVKNVGIFKDTVVYTVDSVEILAVATDSLSSMSIGTGPAVKGSNKKWITLSAGINQIPVKVVAPDTISNTVYSLLITRLPNPNAALSFLGVSAGTLVPAFSNTTDTLRDTIAFSVGSLTVNAATADSQSNILIAGSSAKAHLSATITLVAGINSIPIQATAADGIGTRFYYILAYCYLPLTDPPTNLHAFVKSISSIKLSWNQLQWATRYAIQRSTAPGGTMAQVGSTSDTSYVDTGLSEGGTYFYRLSASNSGGATGLSAEVSATTYSRVSISGQSKVQKVVEGSQSVFSITATGIPAPWYQWQKNGVAIPKAIASACTLSNVVLADNGAIIRCQVGNIVDTIFSNTATLTVDSLFIAPIITTAPHDTNIVFGSAFAMRVAASGTYQNYQWRKNGLPISGAIGTAYTVQSAALTDAGIYSVKVWNHADSAVSAVARVRILPHSPSNLAAQAQSIAKIRLSWSQAGGALWYKLLRSIDSTHFTLACSTAQVSCIDSNLTEGQLYEYRIIAGNQEDISDTSTIVGIATLCGPRIITQPQELQIMEKQTINLSATATGNPSCTFQWMKNNNSIPNAISAQYSLANAVPGDSGDFYVVVTNAVRSVNSSVAHVSVIPIYTLATTVVPTMGGNITRSKDSAYYRSGDSVRLTALAAAGYRFAGWSGDTTITNMGDTSILIVIKKNRSINAQFIRQFKLSIAKSLGMGNVTPSGDTVCDSGKTIQVIATPSSGYRFGTWKGDTTVSDSLIHIPVMRNISISADFIKRYSLTITKSRRDTIYPITVMVVDSGKSIPIIFQSDTGWVLSAVHVASGQAIIADSMVLPANVTLFSGDAVIQIKMVNTVWAWGKNGSGQLGIGTAIDQSSAQQVRTANGVDFLTGIKAISAGSSHTVFVKNDGTVWACGYNGYGQLGDNTKADRSTPVQVRSSDGIGFLSGIVDVSAGSGHSIALAADGTVWAWGRNTYGQLGDGTKQDRSTPVRVLCQGGIGNLSSIKSISAGSWHSLAISNTGIVWAWGRNNSGQLGNGSTADSSLADSVRSLACAPLQVAGGSYHSTALKPDGTVLTWGWNDYGQLGDNSTIEKHLPVQVTLSGGIGILSGVQALASLKGGHTVVIKNDGTVWAWGYNGVGQLGDGSSSNKPYPIQVVGPGGSGFLANIKSVSAGLNHTIALKNDGTVWSWGSNLSGQLGDGSTTSRPTPTQVVGSGGSGILNKIPIISAGSEHSVVTY